MRLKGFNITLDSRTECFQWTSDSDPPTQFSVSCNATGRVVQFGVPRSEYLTLCEVQIFGMYENVFYACLLVRACMFVQKKKVSGRDVSSTRTHTAAHNTIIQNRVCL